MADLLFEFGGTSNRVVPVAEALLQAGEQLAFAGTTVLPQKLACAPNRDRLKQSKE